MKCDNCKEGRMIQKAINEAVEIPGAPTFEVKGVQVLECSNCHDVLIDTAAAEERTKLILRTLVQYYGPRQFEVPGKVAQWMRNAIGLSQNELANEVEGIDPSAFGHAAARNSPIDHYAAFVLIYLSADFVTGGTDGRKLIEKTKKPNQILGKFAS